MTLAYTIGINIALSHQYLYNPLSSIYVVGAYYTCSYTMKFTSIHKILDPENDTRDSLLFIYYFIYLLVAVIKRRKHNLSHIHYRVVALCIIVYIIQYIKAFIYYINIRNLYIELINWILSVNYLSLESRWISYIQIFYMNSFPI